MEGSSQEDLTTRSLLKGILATEPIRSAVKQKNKRRVSELESLLSLSSSGSFHKLTKNASMPSPSMNLRNKMKEKVRRSIGKTASRPSTGKRVAQTDSHSKKRPVRRTRPFVEELDKITPRTLLKKIIQIEPEVSMIVSQRSELTEPKDTNQEIASDHTINSISNLELNLPELEEEERVTAFGNARKKYRISITEFERGVGERLPPTQECSSNKWMEETGNRSVLSHSLRILLGSPEPELSQKHGLVRRPKKHRLVSLKDFEQGVEQNYQLLKGSQECFIDSTEDETSSTSDTSPTENANMNTKLYDLPTLKEKRSHASDTKLEAISEDQQADGTHKEEEKPMELTPGLNLPKDKSPRKSERLQGLKEDNQIYGRTGEKNRDELMETDHDLQKSDEQSLSTVRSHQTEELKLLAHESEQSAELIDSDVEVVVGTPETHTSHLRVDALRVARMTTSAKKDIRSRSILFESSQGGGISLHQVQNLTDSVFTRLSPEDSGHKKGAHLSASIKHTEVAASYLSGSESGNELDLDNQTGPSSVSDPYPIEQTTPQQNIQESRQTPGASITQTERRHKSASASVTKRMSVLQPQTEEAKDQTLEESDNEGEELEESHRKEFQPFSHTKSITPTSHIERHLKSTSTTKRMSVQQPQSDEVKEQTVEEQKNEEEEPMESDNEEFQPSLWTESRASTSRMEQHLKSASINKRKSVRNSQTQEPINQTVEEGDNEAEDSESNAVQPSSWTEPPPSKKPTEKHFKSVSITKWMSVQPKSRESKDQDEEEGDNEIEEQEETGEDSDREEFQPISHTKSRTLTSHIERHLKSTSTTKRMSVKQPQSDEAKEQTVEEQKNEEEEPMESDNEEFQPSLWTESRASTSRMEQHLKSASINKRKSVRNSQTQEPINQTVEEGDNEAEDSESNAVQPSSWTEPPPSTSRTEKRLKSASITKWMTVQPKSRESKDQDVEECDNEIEEQEETGEESDGEEQSMAENPMSSTQKLSLSSLPDTPAYFKNGRFRLAKKPPPVGKRTQKKKHTETSKKEPMMPRSYIKQAFSHYAQTRVAKNAYQEVEKCLGLYMDQLSDDLAVYSAHASRKTVTRADIELLMRRQGLVTDKTSLNTLIAQHLPLDYRKLLVPCASSGNKVFPKM